MKREWMIALRALLVMTALTGLLYPLAVTAVAQAVFPYEANGSLLRRDGRVIGSELLGQEFASEAYFWSRPSATASFPYNALASSGSNLGPGAPALSEAVSARLAGLRKADPGNRGRPVPVDLVTASGSGLDPEISLAAALYQLPRVAKARRLDERRLRQFVLANSRANDYLILGEPRVNVLSLNLALDAMKRSLAR